MSSTRLQLGRKYSGGLLVKYLAYRPAKSTCFQVDELFVVFLGSNLNVLAWRLRAFTSPGLTFLVSEMGGGWLGFVRRLGSRVASGETVMLGTGAPLQAQAPVAWPTAYWGPLDLFCLPKGCLKNRFCCLKKKLKTTDSTEGYSFILFKISKIQLKPRNA